MEEQKVEISLDELRKKSVFVATPMYGGLCYGFFTNSLIQLHLRAASFGIQCQFSSIMNESLICRARNYLVDEFLRSNFTHMMFIDADVEFNPDDIFMMLNVCDEEKGIVCGAYPKKNISYEKVVNVVNKGLVDENPAMLEQFVGDFVLNPVPPKDGKAHKEIKINEPLAVMEGGTGFMLIHRSVFERLADAHPEWEYTPDHIRSEHFDGSRKIHAYFQDLIDPDSNRWLSEDYFFCQEARKIGIETWLLPWIKLNHLGTYRFVGNLEAVMYAGQPVTADPNQLKAMKGKK